MLQSVHSATLNNSIPEQYREPQGYWFGLSLRARPIVYSIERIKPEQLSSYEALADEKWKQKICIRLIRQHL